MSSSTSRKPRGSRGRGAGGSGGGSAGNERSGRRSRMATAGLWTLVLVAVAGAWWGLRPGGGGWMRTASGGRVATAMELPEVPSAGLAPETAALIRKHMDAVRAAPSSALAWGQLGGILKSCRMPGPAARCLEVAERLDPADARWPYHLATLETERGQGGGEGGGEGGGIESPSAVLEALRRAAARAGKVPEAPQLRLARALVEAGRTDEAQREAESLLAARPECTPARLLLAQLRQAAGYWRGAMELAGPCARSPFTARAAATLLASGHRRLGDVAAAERVSRQAATLPPDVTWPDPYEEEVLAWRGDPRSLSDRAQAQLLAGRPEAALPMIERLVKEHPGFAETWLVLGRAQYLQKQPVAAEAALRRHLELDPSSVNGHFQLGMSLLAQQKFPAAADAFRAAIALKPEFGPGHFNLGFALARSGQIRDAVEPFRQAIRHNPEKIDSYILLADLHVQLGEMTEAARLAGLAAQVDSEDRRLPSLRQKVGLEGR